MARQLKGPGGEKAAAAPTADRVARASLRFQKGLDSLASERHSEALEEFIRASELDPTDPRPHHGMGKIYQQLFLREKAEQSFRKAVQADPGYRPSKESLAMILHEKGLYQEAIALLNELKKETPDEPFIGAELALNALALGRPREAIELLEKYNAVKGRQAWGYTHLGRAYAAAGLLDKAEGAYREALAIDRQFSLASYWLGQLLVSMGREPESEPHLANFRRLRQLETEEHEARMALLKNPDDIGALVRLARAHFLRGRPRESLATIERARRVAPGDPRLIELQAKVSRALEETR